jgi:fatty acid desaturase
MVATATAPTMLPPGDLLPDVLPTERLTASGMPVPVVRAELRRIADGRNVLTVIGVYLQSFGVIALAVWLHNPFAWVAAFFLMGRAFALYAILGHEAAHRLLFTNKRVNDWVGRWLLGYPAFVSTDLYRRGHMAHHKDEFGPNEPDLNLYNGYPITRDSLRRKLTRDLFGSSGWKNLKGLLRGLRNPVAKVHARRIVGVQLVLLALFTLAGRPELYLFLWLLPWLTVWRLINRLRSIAEHGGMTRSDDRRLTTHHVHQSWMARFWMVPYNTGWHLAHHVDIGVPFRKLPALHEELVASGWVVPALEHPSYLSLWRKLASRRSD